MSEAVSGVVLAAHLDVTPTTVAALAAKGRVVRVARGQYDLQASTRAYISHLRQMAAGRPSQNDELKAEKKRFATAQADLKEMERDQKAKVMVDVREYEERWAYEVTIFRQIMMGVPSKMAEAITGVSRHDTLTMEDVMRDALQRCSDEVEAQQRRKEAKAEDELRPRRGKRRS